MCSVPVLALHDFEQPIEIKTDACDIGVGAILSQQGILLHSLPRL
jgi:hypothetical protein